MCTVTFWSSLMRKLPLQGFWGFDWILTKVTEEDLTPSTYLYSISFIIFLQEENQKELKVCEK